MSDTPNPHHLWVTPRTHNPYEWHPTPTTPICDTSHPYPDERHHAPTIPMSDTHTHTPYEWHPAPTTPLSDTLHQHLLWVALRTHNPYGRHPAPTTPLSATPHPQSLIDTPHPHPLWVTPSTHNPYAIIVHNSHTPRCIFAIFIRHVRHEKKGHTHLFVIPS